MIGPVGQLGRALDLIRREPAIDAAVLDVNLGGDPVYPAADLLLERRVPVVFTTGYDASAMPTRYSGIARCEKPINISKVADAISRALQS